MKPLLPFLTIVLTISFITSLSAQDEKDRGIFVEEKDGFYKNEILKNIDEFNEPEKEKKKLSISITKLLVTTMKLFTLTTYYDKEKLRVISCLLLLVRNLLKF